MKPHLRRPLRRMFAVLVALCGAASLHAQSAATGTVTGRVYNPALREYVRNAEVRLAGAPAVAFTEGDGSFRFLGVPAGPVTLAVTFAGYEPVQDTFSLAAGHTAAREINLVASGETRTAREIVTLGAFTVSSEREGNAKAVMSQRGNMDIATSVASDIFGDVNDGNVGEFVKYLPGVDLDYVNTDARGVRLGGMDGQYVGVAFDGVRVASADYNRGGNEDSRATSLEAMTITAVDSIEISRTTSADSDGDSPAGTINMKTKRAFDRKERRLAYSFGLALNGDEFTLRKTPGPGDRPQAKYRPNASLEYSGAFFNQRLGLLLNLTHTSSFTDNNFVTMTEHRTPSAADPRPLVVRQISFRDSPRFLTKDAVLLSADFKATPNLVLSLSAIYNYYETTNWAKLFNFIADSGRSRVGGDGILEVVATPSATNTNPALTNTGFMQVKLVYTRTLTPKFEYKLGPWVFDGGLSVSSSVNNYEALERGLSNSEGGEIRSGWVATRPSADSWDWTVRQTSGPDWFRLANYTSTNSRDGGTRVLGRDHRWATEIWSGHLNGRWSVPLRRFPTTLKFGGKWNEETRKNDDHNAWSVWSYIGPGGNTAVRNPTTGVWTNTAYGSWANLGYESVTPFDMGPGYGRFININNTPGTMPRVDLARVAALFHEKPELFVHTATPDNFYTSFVANKRDFRETITAGFGQADVRLTPRLQVRAGVRLENTLNEFKEFDPRLRAEVIAAGFTANAAGRATTFEGLQYQFFSQPRIVRESDYHNWFPSFLVKYQLRPNFEFQAGANKAISRPPVNALSGLWVVDETNFRVNAPNPELQPEHSWNYQTRLAYYFRGRSPGQLSLALSQNDIRNLRETFDYTADEFGVDDPEFASFTFTSIRNSAEARRFRNLELAYNQTLGFLPDLFRGTSVNFAYTRSYASQRRNNLAPHRLSSRLGYAYRRFNGSVGMVWRDASPNGSYGLYKGASRQFDLTLNWRLTKFASLYAQGRNITSEPFEFYSTPTGFAEGSYPVLQNVIGAGASWVFGVKGTF